MSDHSDWLGGVLKHRQPLLPIGTDVAARLKHLPSLKAVIFDIYGTLLISGSGEVGSADPLTNDDALAASFAELRWGLPPDRVPTIAQLHQQIKVFNDARRNEHCPYPEVDIVEVWRRVLADSQLDPPEPATQHVVQLAALYEARANPTWPMPRAFELLARLQSAGLPIGIVSNAQVFTVPLVENLVQPKSLLAAGFDLDLCIFSNRFRHAKPGPRLFDVLRAALARRGILPHEAIYVGNDLLNDVWAARNAGLKTAWFAGDARSCRPRHDDPRCQALCPDVVLTGLIELLECLELG